MKIRNAMLIVMNKILQSNFTKINLLIFGCLFLSTSCSYFKPKSVSNDKQVVARAFGNYLYKKDIEGLVPKGSTRNDSIFLVKNYIDSWIKKNVVLHKAESNLGNTQTEIEVKLQEYRNSLVVYMYEQALVQEKLDTVVTSEEVQKYYNDNPNNFELKENIVRFIFVKANKKAPKVDKLRNWVTNNNPKDRQLIEDYCHQYATDFFLTDDRWFSFDEMVKRTAIQTYDQQDFLQSNRFVEMPDSTNITFVRILEYKIKNSSSPLAFEHDHIRSLIINKRKLELIKEMEKAAFENALKNNDFEIYKK